MKAPPLLIAISISKYQYSEVYTKLQEGNQVFDNFQVSPYSEVIGITSNTLLRNTQ